MLNYSDLAPEKKAFVFELDNVLYPQQDYLLQVYYLFANFLAYTETLPPAKDLLEFLKLTYLADGPEDIFAKAAVAFDIDKKYEENFNRLHVSAKLPLPLLLYPPVLNLLHAISNDQKSIFILTKGNPLMQLNKLKYIKWEGLEKKLKVYFYDELKLIAGMEPLDYIIHENKLETNTVLLIGNSKIGCQDEEKLNIDFLDVSHLLA